MDISNQSTTSSTSLRNEAWLKRMTLLLNDNVCHPRLSVRWLAANLYLSERQFSRKTQQMTGLTPNKLIREAKLQLAYQLLYNQEISSVKAAAHRLQFSDVKYFSRIFFRRFGYHPSTLIHRVK
mgnify:CR=1 FL=1